MSKPTIFIEIGTTERQWKDVSLCNSIAEIVDQVLSEQIPSHPVAICFGGTHYPEKFTKELLEGKFALGTVMPKHALDNLDEKLFNQILEKNNMASAVLLDWAGLGQSKTKVMDLLETTDLEVIKL